MEITVRYETKSGISTVILYPREVDCVIKEYLEREYVKDGEKIEKIFIVV